MGGVSRQRKASDFRSVNMHASGDGFFSLFFASSECQCEQQLSSTWFNREVWLLTTEVAAVITPEVTFRKQQERT